MRDPRLIAVLRASGAQPGFPSSGLVERLPGRYVELNRIDGVVVEKANGAVVECDRPSPPSCGAA